jgi:Ca2+-binding RTX toxin-like protein
MRSLAHESLESRKVLAASFGFISTPGGFVFEITGTDFQQSDATPAARADNIVLWTEVAAGGGIAATNFFMEWVDNFGTWHSLSGGVTKGDIANEAARRGLQPGDFQGFEVKALAGNDEIHLDGTGIIGILPGAPIIPPAVVVGGTPITRALVGERATIDGNAGADIIMGSPEDDIIRGSAGEDLLVGGGGNDTILGGPDDDVILGQGGADKLDGDDGRDLVLGGDGDDTISGGAGDDGWKDGNNENARTANNNDGYARARSIPGPPAWVTALNLENQKVGLFGGNGNDTIDGGDGADDISGDAGSDKLVGGAGHDSLLGDHEDKTPEGGAGTDAWQAGPTTTAGIDFTASDIEKVDTTGLDAKEPTKIRGDYQPGASGDWKFAVIHPDPTGDVIEGPFGDFGPFAFNDSIDLSGWTTDSTSGVQIITGGGNDNLVGSDKADVLEAGPGNDTLVARGGRDYLGGDKDFLDRITGAAGDDLLSGGGDGDLIEGGGQAGTSRSDNNIDPEWVGGDTLTYHNVTIRVDDADKTFPGSPAGVLVSLEGLLDYWTAADRKNGDTVTDNGENYGRGGDAQGDRWTNEAGGFPADNNNDKLRESGRTVDSSIENVIGSDFDDSIWLDVVNNGAHGKAGKDLIYGLEGDDHIQGGDGDDILNGDAPEGGERNHTALTVFGNDTLEGGKGNDQLFGERGLDQLLGEHDDDLLVGGTDVDRLSGGKGQDTIRTEYDRNAQFLVDLQTGVVGSLVFEGFIFGNEGNDLFEVSGTVTAAERFDVMSELALAETDGFSDFENNEDDLNFI